MVQVMIKCPYCKSKVPNHNAELIENDDKSCFCLQVCYSCENQFTIEYKSNPVVEKCEQTDEGE